MARRLALSLLAIALLALPAGSASAAVGLGQGRALGKVARSASTSPLIAPESSCPGQEASGAPDAAQLGTMLCMTEYARAAAGLGGLAEQAALDRSADEKAGDVLRCDSFSHYACEREFTYWMQQDGYLSVPCWHVGENLAWGSGDYGTPGSIFRAWMRSPTHRRNILGEYAEIGIGLRAGELEGETGVRVWSQHFGTHC